jgi:hypothetical protein
MEDRSISSSEKGFEGGKYFGQQNHIDGTERAPCWIYGQPATDEIFPCCKLLQRAKKDFSD